MATGASLAYYDTRFITNAFIYSPLSLKSKVPLYNSNFRKSTTNRSFEVVLVKPRDIDKMKNQGVNSLIEGKNGRSRIEGTDGLLSADCVEGEAVDNCDKKLKSETYSDSMTHAMGAVLTYRHELGMNYSYLLPNMIVGSCLQTPADVDKLKNIGVATIFCLQKDSDLEYFGVDICAIQDRARMLNGIEHIRAPIRDFDPFDLRARFPVVIANLHKAIKRNGGITYVHCTAGLGRAPAVALTYMFWILGYNLEKANKILQAVRPCFPKLESIRYATYDILTGGTKEAVLLQWNRGNCQSVEIAGLDVGWDQKIPLIYNVEDARWNLRRKLPVGRFEYKYIVDGVWTCNPDEPITEPNMDGHVNNYVEVHGSLANDESIELRQRLLSEGAQLSTKECNIIIEKLKALDGC